VKGQGGSPRLQSLVSGVAGALLTVTAVAVLRGAGKSQSAQWQGLPARIKGHAGGRVLIGLIGAAIVGVAIFMIG
jgi:Domain of Unknown Function (DUF1206)